MTDLLLLLLGIFAGVALMVVVLERFSGAPDPQRVRQLQRWLIPLVGLMLVLSVVEFYVR